MALINKIGILQSLGERHSSFTAVSNVSYFPSLILVLVVTFMSSCNNSEPVVFPRTGMSLTELQALIGRTKPDTRPEGKPPNYTHVRVFGIIGKLGAELDSDSR